MANQNVGFIVKRLFWDIETSPNIGLFWRAGFDQNILHDSIIHERKVITIAYKWENESKVNYLTWDKDQDDAAMLKKFMVVANEADELVAHYGDRFDLPWFKTRCLIHDLPHLPDYKTVDTKAWASKHYYFNSNKLDYIGQVLGVGCKIHTDYNLWKDIVLKKCPIALAKMVKYNIQDVKLLERVYHKIKFCAKPKTHQGVCAGNDRWSCPRTGTKNVKLSKVRVTSGGIRQYQMQSLDDGSYYSINATSYENYKKAKASPRSLHHQP